MWRDYINRDRTGCLGDCEHCNKKMYPARTVYLKSWIHTYLNNKEDVDNGNAIMPKLFWIAADTAKEFNVGEYHRSKCYSKETITECRCKLACVIRAMYNVSETDIIPSLDQIIPVFNRMSSLKSFS